MVCWKEQLNCWWIKLCDTKYLLCSTCMQKETGFYGVLYLRSCRCVHSSVTYCVNGVFIFIIILFFEGEEIRNNLFLWALYSLFFYLFCVLEREKSVLFLWALYFKCSLENLKNARTRVKTGLKIILNGSGLALREIIFPIVFNELFR